MCVCVPLTRCRRACEADGGRIYHKAGAGGGRPGAGDVRLRAADPLSQSL